MTSIHISQSQNSTATPSLLARQQNLQQNLHKWKSRPIESEGVRDHVNALRQAENLAASDTAQASKNSTQGKDQGELSFFDLVDIINPLHHIPIVGTMYREITGDEIKAPARILGGALFGGFIGAASSVVNAAIEEGSGKDFGGHVLHFAQEQSAVPPNPQMAQLTPVEREILFEQPPSRHIASQDSANYAVYTEKQSETRVSGDHYASNTGFQQQVPNEAVAERMMLALDQYQAMLKQRQAQRAHHSTGKTTEARSTNAIQSVR